MPPVKVLAVATLALAALVGSANAQNQQQKKHDRSLITSEEIGELQVTNAYEAVQKLHADWLRRAERQQTVYGRTGNRGDASGGGSQSEAAAASFSSGSDQGLRLTVFVNGNEAGSTEELTRIQSNQVEEIRYLSGSEAEQRYGSRYAAGVIQVKLKS
jgi:hypothetical protein